MYIMLFVRGLKNYSFSVLWPALHAFIHMVNNWNSNKVEEDRRSS